MCCPALSLCVTYPPNAAQRCLPNTNHNNQQTGLYKAADWDDAVAKAKSLVEFGGHGHTSCLYTRPTNKAHIQEFRDAMETVRILINSPASQG